MKLLIIATIIVVLSLCETCSGDGGEDGLSAKELRLSWFYDDLAAKGLPEGLSSDNTILKRTKVINIGMGGRLRGAKGRRGKRGGGRRRGRGGRGRGRGRGKVPLHFSSHRLSLPNSKVLFGSGYGKSGGSGRVDVGLKLGLAALNHGLGGRGGYGNNLKMKGLKGYGDGHGHGGYGGGGGGGGGYGADISSKLSAGISSEDETKLLKGIDYETLFDGNDNYKFGDDSSAPFSIGVGKVRGDVTVEGYSDGEVISCKEYDGGYEIEDNSGSHC